MPDNFNQEISRLIVSMRWTPEKAFVERLKAEMEPLTDEQFQIVCAKIEAFETERTITIPAFRKYAAQMLDHMPENPEYCERCYNIGVISYRIVDDPSGHEYGTNCTCAKGRAIAEKWLKIVDEKTGEPKPIKTQPFNPHFHVRCTDESLYPPLPEGYKPPHTAAEVKAFFAWAKEAIFTKAKERETVPA